MSYELIPGSKALSNAINAENMRLNVSAQNIANASTTSSTKAGAFKRKVLVFETLVNEDTNNIHERFAGVKVKEIKDSKTQPREQYAPHHPDADPKTGMIYRPNISPLDEMVDMMTATKTYEAALTMMKQSKQMTMKTINLGQNT